MDANLTNRSALMRADDLPFIDWMKALGIFVIVYGHVAGSTINFLTAPIEAKQIGVVCFLFVATFGLARERRAAFDVVFRRLFVLYVFGICFAAALSLLSYVLVGRAQLGNFLPFFLGANVLILEDAFPANPTTWYIATYVHVVLIWAYFARGFRVTRWALVVGAIVEIAVRVVLVRLVGSFFAYMALTNWMLVLLWGAWQGQRGEKASSAPASGWLAGVATLAVLVLLWPIVGAVPLSGDGFPFKSLVPGTPLAPAFVSSVAVTLLYFAYGDAIFRTTRRLPAPAPIRFLARNTVVVFIVHMPLFYILDEWLVAMAFWPQKAIELLVCLVLPAIASEWMMRTVPFDRFRQWAMVWIGRAMGGLPTSGRGG